jgi:ABC-type sulfate/molybdate transport systems ATPase subunit
MAALALDLTSRLRTFTLRLVLDVGPEVVALAGPSGAGKTTVLRCVAGLRRPDAGRIACADELWFSGEAGNGRRRLELPAEGRSVGYVPQHHGLFPHLTVAGNVGFSGADRAAVAELLERLGIAHLAQERPDRLSGGERQRVALARALARRPRVLLLDEPLAALDAHTRRIVREELADVLRGLAIPTLLVTHDASDAAVLADRVAVVVDGTLRQLAPPAELVAAPADRFVVAFTGGGVLTGEGRGRVVHVPGAGSVAVDRDVTGTVDVALYPWDVEVRPGPGPDGALRGAVAGTAIEGGRVRVRFGAWAGEATSPAGLDVGAVAHGMVRRAHVLAG